VLLLVAFGAKAALSSAVLLAAGLLPHGQRMPVAAIFAALLTKVGVYAIMRSLHADLHAR
jgi:multicomponent Na+:H+ antiporter subunit D